MIETEFLALVPEKYPKLIKYDNVNCAMNNCQPFLAQV
jgi:hypothetical protein